MLPRRKTEIARRSRLNWSGIFVEETKLAENSSTGDKTYKAENLGSGTFIISKPKRKKIKMRQTDLKNPRRGSRK
jgi:hypothetical protein